MGGKVSGYNYVATVTPTLSLTAYSANDQLGGLGTLTFKGNGVEDMTLQSVIVTDKNTAVLAGIEITFFSQDPALTSADNAAQSFPDASLPYVQGNIALAAADYKAYALNSVATVKNIGLKVKTDEFGRVFVAFRTTGTPTYLSTSDLSFTFYFYGD